MLQTNSKVDQDQLFVLNSLENWRGQAVKRLAGLTVLDACVGEDVDVWSTSLVLALVVLVLLSLGHVAQLYKLDLLQQASDKPVNDTHVLQIEGCDEVLGDTLLQPPRKAEYEFVAGLT